MHQRSRWVYFTYVAISLSFWPVLYFRDPSLPAIILFALVAWVVAHSFYLMFASYWVLARSGNEVVLARSSKWTANAVEMVKSLDAPVEIEISGTVFTDKVLVYDEEFYIPRMHRSRLRRIVDS